MNIGSLPCLLLPCPVLSPCLGNGLSPSLCTNLHPPGSFVSPQVGTNLSPRIQATEPPRHFFNTLTVSPPLLASRAARVLAHLRIMQETHTWFDEATSLPMPAYAAARSQAAADHDLMNLWITDHLILSTAQGHLSRLCQRNIYSDDVPYAPNSCLPMLNQLARAELDLAMDEAS